MSVLTHFPKSRLSELVGRFGGLGREEAVMAATRQLESMRPQSDKAILASITQLEALVSTAIQSRDGSPALMKQLLPLCDQIVTLAGTFGYAALDKAARSLCDLLDVLLRDEKADLASIRVHVQSIRMFAPGGRELGRDHIEVMLFELAKLLDHHGFAPVEAIDNEDANLDLVK